MTPALASGPTVVREEVDVDTLEVGRVLREQSAGGEFAWSAEMERLARRRVDGWMDRWSAALARMGDPADVKVIATVKAILLIQVGFADQRSLWQRAVEKAVRFLASATAKSPADLAAWLATVA